MIHCCYRVSRVCVAAKLGAPAASSFVGFVVLEELPVSTKPRSFSPHMRSIPESLDPVVVAGIDGHLGEASNNHGVTIPWAVESGSRAWGFPSPDSDYDCRFIFLRRPQDYLSLWPRRDVIEVPVDPVFDVNGWDLVKALRLLVKGNGTVIEWLQSPIIYQGEQQFRNGLLDLAGKVVRKDLVVRHYYHLGRGQLPGTDQEVSLKRVFYSLRPAAALRWLRVNPGQAIPPMNLRELLTGGDPAPDVVEETERLIAHKAVTRELGTGVFPRSLARFVSTEFELARKTLEDINLAPDPDHLQIVDDFFRAAIEELN